MKHPHPHTTSAVEAAPLTQLAASHSRARLAPAFGAGIQLRWALAVGRSGMDRLAAAAARAEQRVTEQFKVPPGGG